MLPIELRLYASAPFGVGTGYFLARADALSLPPLGSSRGGVGILVESSKFFDAKKLFIVFMCFALML